MVWCFACFCTCFILLFTLQGGYRKTSSRQERGASTVFGAGERVGRLLRGSAYQGPPSLVERTRRRLRGRWMLQKEDGYPVTITAQTTHIYPRSNDLRSGGNSYTRLAMSEIDIFSENHLGILPYSLCVVRIGSTTNLVLFSSLPSVTAPCQSQGSHTTG